MFHNENKNVTTGDGIILWDGITQPGTDDKTGAIIHSLKIAIVENSVEKGELEQLAMNALAADPAFKGELPPGGEWPLRTIDVSKLGDSAALMTGRISINANTRLGAPNIFDANGQQLQAMQYGQMLYPGAIVKLLVHAYTFNNKSKGVAFGLDGIQIINATTPKLDVGGGMSASQAAAAFGGTGAVQPQQPPVQQPAQQQHVAANGAVIMPPANTVQPNQQFVANAGAVVQPPQRVMLPAAQGMTYEAAIGAGWTDEMLIANGMMQG